MSSVKGSLGIAAPSPQQGTGGEGREGGSWLQALSKAVY